MRKIILFSLFIFTFLISPASAFSDDVERYPNGVYTDYWEHFSITNKIQGSTSVDQGTVTAITNPNGFFTTNLELYAAYGAKYASGNGEKYSGIRSNMGIDPSYMSFVVSRAYYNRNGGSGTGYVHIALYTEDNVLITSYADRVPRDTVGMLLDSKYEIIKTSSSTYSIYKNGTLLDSIYSSVPGYMGNVKLYIAAKAVHAYEGTATYRTATYVYVDDISSSSIIGLPEIVTDGQTNISFTWSGQLIRNNPSSEYKITLYSITGENAGKIKEWVISGTSAEHGYISESRNDLLESYYGLYLLEMTKGSIIIQDTYFYHDSLTDPQGFPEILFRASSNVESEIRDENNNGGTISGGGLVYLYPDIKESGVYDISYNVLENPYSIRNTLTKVYNTTTLNGTNLLFSGLSGQNYYVSIDGAAINSTQGLDTWDCSLTWDNANTHTILFSPDLTAPGVWGYVKNSATNSPIKSATVAIRNETGTIFLYTDSDGMYYQTKGITPGSYNVSASKSGYSSSIPVILSAIEGATTRQDFFLDKESGAGVYYAPHDVSFTVLEYWYSSTGLPGVSYAVYDDENESVKNGTTGSKGTFTVKDMDAGKNYTFILNYNGSTYTEYIEPGLTEYTLVLNKEGIIHQYFNSWLNLTYAETPDNVTVHYTSSKAVSEASLTVTASNGSQVQANSLNTTSGSFLFSKAEGDYILQFNIEASDGSTASQAWSISSPPEVNLFPDSYPTWLKNTLFVAIIIIFLLAFGKSKNDIACGSVAVLTSFGYYFEWLSCSFNFVVLVWIIAIGAIFLHYKRTGAVG